MRQAATPAPHSTVFLIHVCGLGLGPQKGIFASWLFLKWQSIVVAPKQKDCERCRVTAAATEITTRQTASTFCEGSDLHCVYLFFYSGHRQVAIQRILEGRVTSGCDTSMCQWHNRTTQKIPDTGENCEPGADGQVEREKSRAVSQNAVRCEEAINH